MYVLRKYRIKVDLLVMDIETPGPLLYMIINYVCMYFNFS